MVEEDLIFYHFKKITRYRGYLITLYENTTNSTLPRYSITVSMDTNVIITETGNNVTHIMQGIKSKLDERESG